MTRDELNKILTQMGEACWNPRLLDELSGEYWDYSSNMMACESGVEEKKLPKDIDIRESMYVEFEMRDDSMIDAGIMQFDSMKARLNAPVTDGKVVLAYYEGRTYVGVYCKDKDGNAWVLPMNKRYRKIYLNDDKDAKIVGRVQKLERREVEVDAHVCNQLIDEAMKELQKPKVIEQIHVSWAIQQIQPAITTNRWWFSVYKAMVQLEVHTKDDYEGFCERIRREVPDHKHLPDPIELSRLDILSFSKPIAKWNIKDAPITQHKRFMEYKEIGFGMLALLESNGDGVGEILRKLSETLKKNI